MEENAASIFEKAMDLKKDVMGVNTIIGRRRSALYEKHHSSQGYDK